ncbi:MAG: DNA-directed RNA polymerase II subunit RPB9, partial [Paramarteilia canceri]
DQLQKLAADIVFDPTLARSVGGLSCVRCGGDELVFLQSRSKRADATMRLYYLCANLHCLHKWT